MDRLDAMRLFVRVVETASFSKAAKVEGLAQPTVSKQIAALEGRLGAQLVRRTSRGLSVTEAGRDYYDSCVRLLGDLDVAESRVGRGRISPAGRIRVALGPGFGRMYVVPRLPAFFQRYPDIAVDFEISDRHVNMIEDGIDVAIRMGKLADSMLIARRIGTMQPVAVATPAYIDASGEPQTPDDLNRHPCVTFMFHGAPRPWEFIGPAGLIRFVPDGRFRCNDAEHIRAAVLSGIGVGYNASWLYAAELSSGAIVPILRDYVAPTYPIHAVSAGRQMSSKVKVFVDFLADILAGDPHLKIR